ncbi:MAG TPA: hypothetical protein VIP75_07380 [Acidothermales bacterium]|jgi:hypothetical protein|nr:antitoxin [Actinomycetes bacterium]
MATIQIRDVPETAYETIRLRARRAGQSIQSYMRDQVIAFASQPTKAEAVAAIEAMLDRDDRPDVEVATLLDDLHADRR